MAAISAAVAAASVGVIVRAATAPIDAYWREERRKSRRRVAEVFCRNELTALRYYVEVAREGHKQLSEMLPPPLPVPPLVLSVPSTTRGDKHEEGKRVGKAGAAEGEESPVVSTATSQESQSRSRSHLAEVLRSRELSSSSGKSDRTGGWSEHVASDGRVYYYNKLTKESTSTLPEELKLLKEEEARGRERRAAEAEADARHGQRRVG